MPTPTSVHGDILTSAAASVVNPWNTNRWGRLLLPSGVSGALKQVTGPVPWRELRAMGPIPLGGAVTTGGGDSPWPVLIHVAGIDWLWRTSLDVVRQATHHALTTAQALELPSVALPLIGSGSGGLHAAAVHDAMVEVITTCRAAPPRVELWSHRNTE